MSALETAVMKVDGRLWVEGLLSIDPPQILLEISVTKTVVFLTPQNHAPNRHVLGWFVFTNSFTNQFATNVRAVDATEIGELDFR